MVSLTNASSSMAAVTHISFASHDNLSWLCTDATVRQWHASRLSPPQHVHPAHLLAASDSMIAIADDGKPRVRHLDANSFGLRHVTRPEPPTGTIIALTCSKTSGMTGATTVTNTSGASGNDETQSPEGYFAVQDPPFIRIHRFSGDLVTSRQASTPVFSAELSMDGEILLTGDSAGTVRVYNLRDSDSDIQEVRPHRRAVSGVALTENHVASVSWDGRLVVAELRPKLSVCTSFHVEKGTNRLQAVATGGGFVAAAGDSGTVRVWHLPGSQKKLGSPIAVYDAHSAAIYSLAFSPCARSIASGCADGTVRLLGVPTPPMLISDSKRSPISDSSSVSSKPSSQGSALLHVTPVDAVTASQAGHRRLIFCPSRVVNLECPVCATAYDADEHAPMCSGVCGHTFACSMCSQRLCGVDSSPTCPICRATLRDVAPNYELLRILDAAAAPGAVPTPTVHNTDFIDRERLSWIEDDSSALASLHSCIIVTGMFDGEPVSIRVPHRRADANVNSLFRGDADAIVAEAARHVARARTIRAPHIAALYGVAREHGKESRIVAVGELPSGGTLSRNLNALRNTGGTLGSRGVAGLAIQLLRALRSLHDSGFCAAHALSPRCIGIDSALVDGWGAQGQRLKLLELGGTRSKEELSSGGAHLLPMHFVPYLAPEALDSDTNPVLSASALLIRAQQADMYSAGVLIWEIATLKHPFAGLTPVQIIGRVVGRDERPGDIPGWLAPEIRELIARLWVTQPEERPNCTQACDIMEQIPSAPPPPIYDVPAHGRHLYPPI